MTTEELAIQLAEILHEPRGTITADMIETAAGQLQRRLAAMSDSPDNLFITFDDPIQPVSDLELALLRLNAGQALADGNPDLASLFQNLINYVIQQQHFDIEEAIGALNDSTTDVTRINSQTTQLHFGLENRIKGVFVGGGILILMLLGLVTLYFYAPSIINWVILTGYGVSLLIYIVLRVVNWRHSILDVNQFPDTAVFLGLSSLPLLSWSFWAGGRSFTVPLIYKILKNNLQLISIFQFTFSLLSWGFLASVIALTTDFYGFGLVMFATILAFSLSQEIIMWDKQVLSESISLSLLALFVASWVWLLGEWQWPQAVAVIVTGFLWAFSRDANAWILFMLAGLLFPVGLIWHKGYFILAGLFFSFFITSVISANKGQRWVSPFLNVLAQRILPNTQMVKWFEQRGMPVNPALTRMVRKWAHSENWAFYEDPALQSFRDWLYTRGKSRYYRFLLSDIARLTQDPLRHIEILIAEDLSNYYPKGFRPILKGTIAEIIFPMRHALLLTWLAGVLIGLSGATFMSQQNSFWLVPLFLILLAYPHVVIVWHGDAMEVPRHALMASIQLRLGVWITVLFAVNIVLTFLVKSFFGV